MLWVCSSRPLELHFVRAWDCCTELSHLYRSTHDGIKVSTMPLKTVAAYINSVAVSVWISFASSIDVCFLIFAYRSPCQQCHDSVAGHGVGRSAAGVEFLFYHSNFVNHHPELKSRKNCNGHLVRHFQLVSKASQHLYTAQAGVVGGGCWSVFICGHGHRAKKWCTVGQKVTKSGPKCDVRRAENDARAKMEHYSVIISDILWMYISAHIHASMYRSIFYLLETESIFAYIYI